MLQLRKKILVGVLCAAMLLSASQSAWSETAEVSAGTETAEAAETVETESSDTSQEADAESEEAESEEEEEVTSITEEEALADMKEYARTDSLVLYVDEQTGIFAVQNLADGKYTWSNPYNSDYDPLTKSDTKRSELKSSLVITGVKVTDTEAPSTTLRSAQSGTITVEAVDGGFKATVEFANEGIRVPYYVTVTDDHFDVTVAVDEIYEVEMDDPDNIKEASRSIVELNLFPDLGAGGSDEEGYIVTPDGSGAVINFNNGKTGAADYTQTLYGRDLAVSQDTAPKKTEQAYLPIMGIVKEDSALLAVVTEGSAYATARASISEGQRSTGYNSAWFRFALRTTDTYYMGGSNASALKAYQESRIPESTISVRYYPIAKEDASYVDIALRYQQYLVEEKGLTKKTTADQSPFYLDIYGGTVKERSVMGFPVNLQTAATTYEQAKEIIEAFTELGVSDMIVTYEDFNKAGITSRISNSVEYSSVLGGKSDFQELMSYCDGIGALLVPSVDLMEYERSGNGYSKTGASVIGVTKAYATQLVYERAFGTPHDTRSSWYILTPAYFTKVYGEVVTSYSAENMSAISVADGTNKLYSDFSGNNSKATSRQQALENLKQCYEMINNSGLTFVAGACNDYALPYVDYIRDVPLYSSGFDIYDYDIPLYEIVIHGYIPYTTKAKNASSSADELFLYSVATGTPVHYAVMYENPNEFTDCEYDELFYTYYEGWLETAAIEYKICSDIVSEVSESTITNFEYIDSKVIETTFSNGTVIRADLANDILYVNGEEINLAQYGWKGATTD